MVEGLSATEGIDFISTSKADRKSTGLVADTETFLKLLTAQLQYQDPLEPQTDTDFVAQLAQLTSLEQMQQMNLSLDSTQAMDVVGRFIYAEVLNPDTGVREAFSGVVDSVIIKNGSVFVVTGGKAIPLENVLIVANSIEVPEDPEAEKAPYEEDNEGGNKL